MFVEFYNEGVLHSFSLKEGYKEYLGYNLICVKKVKLYSFVYKTGRL
jgi:hypothetical protein